VDRGGRERTGVKTIWPAILRNTLQRTWKLAKTKVIEGFNIDCGQKKWFELWFER
jgi:hypothetical protein